MHLATGVPLCGQILNAKKDGLIAYIDEAEDAGTTIVSSRWPGKLELLLYTSAKWGPPLANSALPSKLKEVLMR